MKEQTTAELIKAGFWQGAGTALFWGSVLLVMGLVTALSKPAAPANQEKTKCSA